MNEQQLAFWKIIGNLSELGLLEHVAVIGSWAEYLYEFEYEDFVSNLKTKDVDIFYKNIRKPAEKIALVNYLEENGFISETDGFGVTRFLYKGGFELEFLVPQYGAGRTTPYTIVPLGITAEGLRFTIIEDELIPIKANDFIIYVPGPWAYVLHKLAINPKRKEKQLKDIDAIRLILGFFEADTVFLANLNRCYRLLGKSNKATVDRVCVENMIDLGISK